MNLFKQFFDLKPVIRVIRICLSTSAVTRNYSVFRACVCVCVCMCECVVCVCVRACIIPGIPCSIIF